MSLEFTKLQCIKVGFRNEGDPDKLLCEMVKRLDGKIKDNWQIIAPSPQIRVLYFEADESFRDLKPETGSSAINRDIALGKDVLKPKGNKNNRKTRS